MAGNPGGRPKGIVSKIREQTDDGAEMVDLLLGVMRDATEPAKLRMEAAKDLLDRGFGRAVQTTAQLPVEPYPGQRLVAWDPADLNRLTDDLEAEYRDDGEAG